MPKPNGATATVPIDKKLHERVRKAGERYRWTIRALVEQGIELRLKQLSVESQKEGA